MGLAQARRQVDEREIPRRRLSWLPHFWQNPAPLSNGAAQSKRSGAPPRMPP